MPDHSSPWSKPQLAIAYSDTVFQGLSNGVSRPVCQLHNPGLTPTSDLDLHIRRCPRTDKRPFRAKGYFRTAPRPAHAAGVAWLRRSDLWVGLLMGSRLYPVPSETDQISRKGRARTTATPILVRGHLEQPVPRFFFPKHFFCPRTSEQPVPSTELVIGRCPRVLQIGAR